MDLEISLDEVESGGDRSDPGSCGTYPGCQSPGGGGGGDDDCTVIWFPPAVVC